MPNESIGVFIGATLPGMVWMSEKEVNAQFFGNVFMLCEFFAIIGSYSPYVFLEGK